MFGDALSSDEQDDFQIFPKTGMSTVLSNVERRHSRFGENHENHCADVHSASPNIYLAAGRPKGTQFIYGG